MDKDDKPFTIPPESVARMNRVATRLREDREDPEGTIQAKLEIYEKTKKIVLDNPGKFRVMMGKDDFYKSRLRAAALVQTKMGPLTLSFELSRHQDEHLDDLRHVYIHDWGARDLIYRLDVRTGPQTTRDFEFLDSSDDDAVMQKIKKSLIDTYRTKLTILGDTVVMLDGNWGESKMSDKVALSIIDSITSIEEHPRYSDEPTLEFVLKRHREAKEIIGLLDWKTG